MFKFTFDEKEYILDDENFDEVINDIKENKVNYIY